MNRRTAITSLLALGLALAPPFAVAAADDQHLSAGGVDIYYGILPAALIQPPLPATDLHAKASSSASHHLVVALYDSRTRQRITDATVSAKVSSAGFWHEDKPLPLMTVANQPSYGNFFTLTGSDRYRVDLSITLKGAASPIRTSFEYRLPREH